MFRIEDFQRAREQSDRVQRNLQDLTESLGIANENYLQPADHVETIEECVEREEREAEVAERQRKEEEEKEHQGQSKNLREKILQQAALRREQLRNLNVSRMQAEAAQRRDQISRTFNNFRDRVPTVGSRVRSLIQRN